MGARLDEVANNSSLHPQVLFVADARSEPDEALRRAHEITVLLDGSLIVLRIAAPIGNGHLFRHHDLAHALAEAKLAGQIAGDTRAWCARVLPDPLPARHLMVRVGDLTAESEVVAERLAAMLIVLPPEEACRDDLAVAVVRDLEVPVLVARPHRAGAAIVAATDLVRDGYPVLAQGAALAARTHGALTCVHNIAPVMSTTAMAMGLPYPATVVPTEAELEAWQQRLDELVHELSADGDSVVTSRTNTADAILEVAADRDADVVVVGAHPRSWLDRLIGDSVASRVVERADRSVLVVPTPDRRRGVPRFDLD